MRAHARQGVLDRERELLASLTETWHVWISRAFLNGYLEAAGRGALFPRDPAELHVLLEAFLLEKALSEVGTELTWRPERAWMPLQGILRILGR